MKLDYGYAEGLLKKAEEINSYLDKEGEYPDRIPYDPDVCQRCDFRHICVPEEHFQSQVDILEDKKLEEMLDRRGEVKENRFEYERLDKEIKAIGKEMEKDNLLIGNWIISRKTSIGKRKPSPGGTYTISRIKIQKMEDK